MDAISFLTVLFGLVIPAGFVIGFFGPILLIIVVAPYFFITEFFRKNE